MPLILTKRQNEILGLLGQGHTRDEVAEKLYIEKPTVDNHLNDARKRVNAKTKDHLLIWYGRYGAIEVDFRENNDKPKEDPAFKRPRLWPSSLIDNHG